MPIYDFTCKNCNTTFEAFAKIETRELDCPECEGTAVRQISAPAFQLKGDGFYGRGSFTKAKQGPKLDEDFMKLSDAEMNKELGLPEDTVS